MLACMFSCRSSESSIICQLARSSRSLLRSAELNSLLVGLLACSRAYFLRLFLSGPWPLHYSTDIAPWRLAFVFIYFFCVHVFSCVYTCIFWWYMACLPVCLVVLPLRHSTASSHSLVFGLFAHLSACVYVCRLGPNRSALSDRPPRLGLPARPTPLGLLGSAS